MEDGDAALGVEGLKKRHALAFKSIGYPYYSWRAAAWLAAICLALSYLIGWH